MDRDWEVCRKGFRYILKRCVWWDALGAGYKFYRENGTVVRFWRRRSAEALAAELNGAER